MDVVVARPDGVTKAVAALVVLALLLAALVLGVLRVRDNARLEDARAEVLAAARQEALNFTTISYRTARRDLGRILAGTTGPLHTRIASELSRPDVIARNRSISRGSVLAAALMHLNLDAGVARCLVATDAQVTTRGAGGARQRNHLSYRMVVTMQRVDGRWLASSIAFDGMPR